MIWPTMLRFFESGSGLDGAPELPECVILSCLDSLGVGESWSGFLCLARCFDNRA